jgi:hypothetical protein
MNDKEWFELKKEVQKAIIMNNNYGEFISSRRNGNNNYMITIRCPHCSEDVIYDNYEQRRPPSLPPLPPLPPSTLPLSSPK